MSDTIPSATRSRAIAYNNYGLLLAQQHRLDEAENLYKQALNLVSKYADAHNNLANLYVALGRKPDARKHYEEALRSLPDNISGPRIEAYVHNNYAMLLESLGQREEAIEHYERALTIDPAYTDAHSNYASLLTKLGKLSEAEMHYKKALGIS